MNIIDDIKLTDINGKWCHNGEPYTGIGKVKSDTLYYKDGKYHREDGLPAIENENSYKEWHVNGKQIYSWEQYQQETNCSKEQIVMYKLTHGDIKHVSTHLVPIYIRLKHIKIMLSFLVNV